MRLTKAILLFLMVVLTGWIGLTSSRAAAGSLFEASSDPDLTIAKVGPVLPGTTVSLPVTLHSGGYWISSTFFAIDYDETRLSFNPADNDGDGIPDALKFSLPYAFSTEVRYDANSLNGELKILIYDYAPPLAVLPDGDLLTIDFTALETGDPWTVAAAVNFSQNPMTETFGQNGQNVPGTVHDGSISIAPPGTVIDTPTATPTKTATPTFTPSPTATQTQPGVKTPAPSLTPTPTDIVIPPAQSGKTVYLPFSLLNSPQLYTISGRVLDLYNHAVPGVTISAGDGWTAVTDSRGKYTLKDLPPGTYVITANKSNYIFSPVNRFVTIPPDASGVNFTAR